MPTLTAAALASLQGQTRAASEVSHQTPAPAQDAPERGSLLHTLKWEGNGYWIATTAGNVWCGAKGFRPIDLNNACTASLLPEGVPRLPYCSHSRGCRHNLPRNYEVVHSTKVLSPAELLKKGNPGKGGEKGKKGKGKEKSKGKGKDKEKPAKRAKVADEGDD